ncbi:MAG: Maf family protein [Coriobacteriia bacterium]|nr:Maf family protein [Coriobacteriia bacterium]
MAAPSLVLASASPRRRRLVAWLGLPVAVSVADVDEDLTAPLPPDALACSVAADKALAVRGRGATGLVLAFDTIVIDRGQVLGKPADRDDARRMLHALSGGVHEVITGAAILPPGAAQPDVFAVTTPVTMLSLPETTIEAWVGGEECLGCAGAYNIEHHLASVADDECFQNVAGLPLCHLFAELASGRAGEIPPGLTKPVDRCERALGRRCLLGRRLCAEGS